MPVSLNEVWCGLLFLLLINQLIVKIAVKFNIAVISLNVLCH